MAIDQTNVALTIADKMVHNATQLLDAFEEMEDLLTHALKADINMVDYDEALANSSIKHVDGATINKMAAVIPGIKTFLAGTSTGGQTYETILYKLRNGN